MAISRKGIEILAAFRNWRSCTVTPGKFERALAHGALTVFQTRDEGAQFVVKHDGKQIGVATRRVILPDGQEIHEGDLLAPTDQETSSQLRRDFDRGKTHTENDSSQWVKLGRLTRQRSLVGTHDIDPVKLLGDLQAYAATAPDTLPAQPDGYPSRRDYRSDLERDHFNPDA